VASRTSSQPRRSGRHRGKPPRVFALFVPRLRGDRPEGGHLRVAAKRIPSADEFPTVNAACPSLSLHERTFCRTTCLLPSVPL
jgi:hypothetical protein